MKHEHVVVFECLFTGNRVTETVIAPTADPKLSAGLFVKDGHYVRSIEYVGADPQMSLCASEAIEKGGILV